MEASHVSCLHSLWDFQGTPSGHLVLLAELAIAPVLWRITRSLSDVIMCAYVDDLNMIASCKEQLLRVVACLREFEEHFSLSPPQAKTRVWASNSADHNELRA